MDLRRPEEQAAEKENEQRRLPGKILKESAQVLSFLSPYIPAALAVKGISRAVPSMSKFFSNITKNGYNIQQGLNFLRKNVGMETVEEKQDIEKEPQLNPQNLKEAERIVALNKFNAKKKATTLQERERERFNKQYGGLQAQQGQPQPMDISSHENTDQALLAALEKILQM